jgi:hypothetical protein
MDSQLRNGSRQRERRSECAHGPSDAARCERRHAVSEQDTTQTESRMSDDEPNAEGVVG